jgi:hypothetical protein
MSVRVRVIDELRGKKHLNLQHALCAFFATMPALRITFDGGSVPLHWRLR